MKYQSGVGSVLFNCFLYETSKCNCSRKKRKKKGLTPELLTLALLATMRPAVGNHILNGANVTVTGTTYDAFSTSVIPEPTALGLVALGLLAFAHLRKRKR